MFVFAEPEENEQGAGFVVESSLDISVWSGQSSHLHSISFGLTPDIIRGFAEQCAQPFLQLMNFHQ